jgi:uncharacterized protein YoxC
MKRDFLKNLGIEDKDIIDKIMDENSADIGRAKGELESLKEKVANLENDIKTKETTIATLQTKADSVDGLNQQISQLETDKTNLTNELTTKVTQIKKDYAVENEIRNFKGKNIKAIKALLDESKITYENEVLGGVAEQLTALASAEDSSMLFGDTQTAPAGTHVSTPPANGGNTPPAAKTFVEAITNALGKQN